MVFNYAKISLDLNGREKRRRRVGPDNGSLAGLIYLSIYLSIHYQSSPTLKKNSLPQKPEATGSSPSLIGFDLYYYQKLLMFEKGMANCAS